MATQPKVIFIFSDKDGKVTNIGNGKWATKKLPWSRMSTKKAEEIAKTDGLTLERFKDREAAEERLRRTIVKLECSASVSGECGNSCCPHHDAHLSRTNCLVVDHKNEDRRTHCSGAYCTVVNFGTIL